MAEILKRYRPKSFGLLIISFLFISAISYTPCPIPAFSQELQTGNPPPPFVSAQEKVLWDQTDNISGDGFSSQNFTDAGGVNDIYDDFSADDFIVPKSKSWSVETVVALGIYSLFGPVESLNVYFFEDSGGLPGAAILDCSYPNILPLDANNSNFTIPLPHPCLLDSGIYWVTVQANMASGIAGQWYFSERDARTLSPFAFENPNDGFGTGCITFSPAQAECEAIFEDLNFQIIGEDRVNEVDSVPALGDWGMVGMFLILGLFGIFGILAAARGATE